MILTTILTTLLLSITALVWCYLLGRRISREVNTFRVHSDFVGNEKDRLTRLERAHSEHLEHSHALAQSLTMTQRKYLGLAGSEDLFQSSLEPKE